MDDFWKEAIRQVPSLVVLVWVVARFLSESQSIEKRRMEYDRQRDARTSSHLKEMRDACHLVQRDSVNIMTQLREEMGESRAVNASLIQHLNRTAK